MSEVRRVDAGDGPALESESLRVSVRLDEGTFSLAGPDGRAAVPEAWTEVVVDEGETLGSRGAGFDLAGDGPVEDKQGRGRGLSLRRRARPGDPEVTLTATLYEGRPFAAFASALRNTTSLPLAANAFHVVRTGPLPLARSEACRFYRHGWQSWSPTMTLAPGEDDLRPFPPVVDPITRPEVAGVLVSELVASLADPASGEAVTAGFVSTADQLSQVWLDRAGAVTATSYGDGMVVGRGGVIASERAVVDITSTAHLGLQTYGDALGREMDAVGWPHAPSGWCSWYQYFGEVTEADVLANLERLDGLRDDGLALEYVQVDDGYQAGIGDWLTVNEKFPRGMAGLAERIHERGFKAGLWLAPFLAGARSRLFAEHPDWLVTKEGREPVVAIQNWGQLCYALDCTRPDVIEWVEGVFRTVTEGWGYDYVKIDFVYAAAVEGRRSDARATRAQAYRRGLEAVRRAVGERFVLGCGAPIGPSVGLVNGMRIGPDVAPRWYPLGGAALGRRTSLSFPSALNSIRNTITRYWTHDRLWVNDPDCLLLRDSQTDLTDDEARTLATVIAMSGGMALDSDDLSLVPDERRRLLAAALSLRGEAAVPLDMFERELPQALWRAGERLLALFNWEDGPAEVRVGLPVSPAALTDYWTGEEVASDGSSVTLTLPAHGSRLLRVGER